MCTCSERDLPTSTQTITILAIRQQESAFRGFGLVGQCLSGGLLLFGTLVLCLSAFSLVLAEKLTAWTSSVHHLAIYLSQVVAVTTLGTGYVEHKSRQILLALVAALTLQACPLISSSCCNTGFVRWLAGASSELRLIDFCNFLAPFLANSVLVWAYSLDSRLRHTQLTHVRRSKRMAR